MQRNTLMRRFGQTVGVGVTGFLTLAMLWLGSFWFFAPTAIANPIESEAGLIEYSSDSLFVQSAPSELEDKTNYAPPAEESVNEVAPAEEHVNVVAPAEDSVNVVVNVESQAPLTAKLDLQVVDTIKIQTEKALQLVEVNAKEVFVQAKGVAEKASSKAEDAFDEFIVWLKAFSS